jgi:hypothetical protein
VLAVVGFITHNRKNRGGDQPPVIEEISRPIRKEEVKKTHGWLIVESVESVAPALVAGSMGWNESVPLR